MQNDSIDQEHFSMTTNKETPWSIQDIIQKGTCYCFCKECNISFWIQVHCVRLNSKSLEEEINGKMQAYRAARVHMRKCIRGGRTSRY